MSFLAEEIAKDPTSTIAVAHEMARKNGTTPGAFNPTFVGLALLAALGMVAVDARHKPVLASVAYSITVFVTVSATLARMPAFAQSLASVPQTALAATVTVLAGVTGGGFSRGRRWSGYSAFSQWIRKLILPRMARLGMPCVCRRVRSMRRIV